MRKRECKKRDQGRPGWCSPLCHQRGVNRRKQARGNTTLRGRKRFQWRHDGNGVFLDNLAAEATNNKAVLAQLADNNTKLVNTNEELAATVKQLTNEKKQLRQEINTLRRRGGAEKLGAATMQQGARELVCTVPIVNGRYIMCQTLVTSWKIMPANGRRDGVRACDEM